MYFDMCKALRIYILSGYSFISLSKSGTISPCALKPPAVQIRLDSYVRFLQGSLSGCRFTLRGFRSGLAISMALADVSLNEIMDQVKRPSIKTVEVVS